MSTIKAYANDVDVLRLADAAGCGMSLRAAASRPHQTTIVTTSMLFIAHGADEGYSAFGVDDALDMPLLLMRLAPLLGTVQSARLEAHDSTRAAADTRH